MENAKVNPSPPSLSSLSLNTSNSNRLQTESNNTNHSNHSNNNLGHIDIEDNSNPIELIITDTNKNSSTAHFLTHQSASAPLPSSGVHEFEGGGVGLDEEGDIFAMNNDILELEPSIEKLRFLLLSLDQTGNSTNTNNNNNNSSSPNNNNSPSGLNVNVNDFKNTLSSVISSLETLKLAPRVGAVELEKSMSSELDFRRASSESQAEVEVVDWIKNEYVAKPRSTSPIQHQSALSFFRSLANRIRTISRLRGSSASTARRNNNSNGNENDPKHSKSPASRNSMSMLDSIKPFAVLTQHIADPLIKLTLENITSWDTFDIFELHSYCPNRVLSIVMTELFDRLAIFDKFALSRDVFASFIMAIEDGYKDVPYHNNLHAADVVQNTYFFLQSASIAEVISEVDVFATLVGAAIHDFQHPGTNNAFQIATNSDIAIRYNDRSVLENMHCADAFMLMKHSECNILNELTPEQRKEIRSIIVSIVLATDMSQHFSLLASFKSQVEEKKKKGTKFELASASDRLLCVELAMHAADLGNPGKPLSIYLRHTDRIVEEFFQQGDQEKKLGLPISLMCDRSRPNLERSQIGFIDHVVRPLYDCLVYLCPEANKLLELLAENRAHWASKLPTPPTPSLSGPGGLPLSSPRGPGDGKGPFIRQSSIKFNQTSISSSTNSPQLLNTSSS